MQLELRSKGVQLTAELRSFIARKLRFALGRFGHRIRSVRVRLTDINGPRGGEDIECHLRANLGSAGVVTISETSRDPFAAIARASNRASQHMSRRLSRGRRGRRGR